MSKPLGFIVWTEDDSTVYRRGEKGEFSDGLLVSLYHSLKDFLKESDQEINQLNLKIELIKNEQIVAEHSFSMERLTTIWLVVDPSDSDTNGSFTTAFLSVFANEPAGNYEYTVNFYVNNELFNKGTLSFASDGNNAAFKTLIPKFENTNATRAQATFEHQQEYAAQMEKEAAEQKAAEEFVVHIENTDKGHTKYVVCTSQASFSEKIYEVLPKQTLTLNLTRGNEYEVKYFDQDSSKEYAFFIEMLNENFHEAIYKIN